MEAWLVSTENAPWELVMVSRGLLWTRFHPVWLIWCTCHPEAGKLELSNSVERFPVFSKAFNCKPMTFLSCLGFALAIADSQAVSWGIWKLSTCSLDPDLELYSSLGPEYDFLHWTSLALVVGQ